MKQGGGGWNLIKTGQLGSEHKLDIIEIWNKEFPIQLQHSDPVSFEKYLSTIADARHILVLNDEDKVIGWAATFSRHGSKWFLILLDSEIQGKSLGKKIIITLKQMENELNGWVVDHDNDIKEGGVRYQSPLGFYLKLDFKVLEAERREKDGLSSVRIQWKKDVKT